MLYWKIQNLLSKICFFFKKSIYKFNIWKYYFNEKTSDLISLVFQTIKQIVFNIIAFYLLSRFDVLMKKTFNIDININSNLLSDILIALIGVAGVLLGLYCSYISMVFSSKYINSPETITKLFRNDTIINSKIKSITNYIIFSLIIIIANICKMTIGISLLVLNVAFAIYMIISYIYIGKRILIMSNTFYLSNPIQKNILIALKNFKSNSNIFTDVSILNHIKKTTIINVNHLKSIAEYNISQKDNKEISIMDFMTNNLYIIRKYLKVKTLIPSDSVWFQFNEYKKMYTANDTELTLMLNTGTFNLSKNSIDKFWLENLILNINQKCLHNLIDNNSIESIKNYVFTYQNLIEDFVCINDDNYFVDQIHSIQKTVTNFICKNNIDIKEEMALTESILLLYIQLVIEINNYIDSIDVNEILSYFINNYHNPKEYLYFINHTDIYNLKKGIEIEKKLEKEMITPDWYIKEQVAKHIYDNVLSLIKIIVLISTTYIPELAENLKEYKKYASATFVYSRYIEFHHKSQNVIPKINKLLSKLQEYNLETKNNVWEEYSSNEINNKIESSYNKIQNDWSVCASVFTISNIDEYNKFPDMLGFCYNNICHYLIGTILSNEISAFKNVYKNLFSIVSLYQELIRKEVIKIKDEYKQSAVLSAYSDPIIDFGYISGYAYLWGEISNKEEWKSAVTNTFDAVVNKTQDKETLCKHIVEMFKVPQIVMPAIYSRSILHTDWKLKMQNMFYDCGYLKFESRVFDEVLVSDSELLKKVFPIKSDISFPMIESYEIFAIMVVNKYLEEKDIYKSKSKWEVGLYKND